MKNYARFIVKFSLVFFLVAFVVLLFAPDDCRDWLCLFSKETVFVFSVFSYFILLAIISLLYRLYTKKEKDVSSKDIEHKGTGVSKSMFVKILLAGVASPFGTVLWLFSTDGLDVIFEDTVCFVCTNSWRCLDLCGDSLVLVTGILTSFAVVFVLLQIVHWVIKPIFSKKSQ